MRPPHSHHLALRQGTLARLRHLAALGLALLLVTTTLVGVQLATSPAPAEARYATGGSSPYTGMIDWFEWGDVRDVPIANNTTKTNTRNVGGQTLETSCTLSALSGLVSTYRPGSWQGDALDDLYNIGGVGGSNQFVSGIANTNQATLVGFDFSCTATLNNIPVKLPGIVMADAEQSNDHLEWIEATPNAKAQWRIIDRFRSAGCTAITQASLTSTTAATNPNQLTLGSTQTGKTCSGAGSGPMTVAFLDGAASAKIRMKGGGKSAIALGVMFSVDYGDAPISYGQAGAVLSGGWAGGEPTPGTAAGPGLTNLFDPTFSLATRDQPSSRFGAAVDAEGLYPSSPDAQGDDIVGTPDDEDAFSAPIIAAATPGQSYALPRVSCTGPAAIVGQGAAAGWIDWNRNGTFEPGEKSTVSPCVGGFVTLTWPVVPLDTVRSSGTTKTFLRLRIAPTADGVLTATGLSTGGEVEDYAINVTPPLLKIVKTSTATASSRPGDEITYTVTATNSGPTAFTANYPAVLSDDLSGVLDDATYSGGATASVPGTLSYSQPVLRWSGVLAVNASVTLSYKVTLGSNGNGVVRNVAFADRGATPTCTTQNADGSDTASGVACGQHTLNLPRMTVAKTASSTSLPAVGAPLTFTIVVSNAGPGQFTAAAPARISDDLSDVLDDASIGTPSSTVGTASITAGVLTWSGALAAGTSATISYTATYNGNGNQFLNNSACAPVAQVLPGAQPCSRVNVPAALVSAVKTSSPSSATAVAPGAVVGYTLSYTNTGQAAGAATSFDALTGVLDDAAFNTGTLVATGGLVASYDAAGKKILITGTLAPGGSGTISYSVTVKTAAFGDAVLQNFVLYDGQTPASKCLPGNTLCTSHPVTGVFHLSKAAVPAVTVQPSPGDTVSYTVTARGQGGAVTGVVLQDTLRDVLDDATFVAGSARLVVDAGTPLAVADPSAMPDAVLTTAPFTLNVNSTATLTYSVTINAGAWSKAVRNTVTGSSATAGTPATCAPCETLHTTTAKVLLDKLGESSAGTWVPMPDSAFAIYANNDGAVGAPLAANRQVTAVAGVTGRFAIESLAAGTYWLQETMAPEGFALLAEPVQFTITTTGVVVLTRGAGDGVVTAGLVTTGTDTGRSLVTVRDVPAMTIPEAGGSGTLPFTLGGGLLLAAALGLFLRHRTRRTA